MSEYQYYEFQAIDKPLTEQDMQALRELSTRAQITPTHFVNTYNWGNFRGDPDVLMKKYFDAFLYLANWGTHQFMLRIPVKLLNPEIVDQYCVGEGAAAYVKGEYLILEFESRTEDYKDEEGEGWLSSLISLRSDLIRGDYRCLYLAWLLSAQVGELDDDEVEPPVPPNLGQLNASLKSFADFMRIGPDLITVAAESSVSEDRGQEYQRELSSWISGLPDTVKNEFLLRLVAGNDPHLGAELLQRFKQALLANKDIQSEGNKRRTVGELLERAKTQAEERERRHAELKATERARMEREKAIARENYLADLALHEDEAWKKVEAFIEAGRRSDYEEAVKLLVDLRDVSRKKRTVDIFEDRLQNLCLQYSRKSSFIRLLKDAGLGGKE